MSEVLFHQATFKIQLNQLKCTSYCLKQGELNNRQPMANENQTLTAFNDSEFDQQMLLMGIMELLNDLGVAKFIMKDKQIMITNK